MVRMLCSRSASLTSKHANVGRNGDQELAEILGLLGLLGDQVEALDLGQAIDQGADLGPEHLVDLGTRGVGVFDDVMQQRRDDRGVVELQVGQNGRNFEGMGKVRIA